jgi:hypothetical protein
MQTFTSSLDKASRIVVVAVLLIGLGTAGIGTYAYIDSGYQALTLLVFLSPLIVLGLVIAMYRMMVLSIDVDKYGITINRKSVKPVVIYYTDIKTIRQLDQSEMKNSIRTFGNGGVFGYTGKFLNRKLGSMTLYCTQRKNYVLIEKMDGTKIIISPDDPAGLVKATNTER